MRLLLLMLFIIVSSIAIAQNPQVQVQKIPKLNGKVLSKSQTESLLKLYKYNSQFGNNLGRIKRKPGINYLADGMPCIVPEEPTAGIIPNAFRGIKLYTIPNPALPKK